MTGHVQSPVKSLSLLRINPMPARPTADMRVVRVPSTGTIVAIDGKGRLYSTQISSVRRRSFVNLDHGKIRPTIEGLVKLGALSTAAVKEHQTIVRREEELGARRSAASSLLEDVKLLGIKMTRAQLIKIELALGAGPRARAQIADKLGIDVLKGFK